MHLKQSRSTYTLAGSGVGITMATVSNWEDPLCMHSAGTGCSWAAERSWHAPLSHGLRRLRLRRRQGWWWMGCRPRLPSPFDRAAVICYRATVASINFWHMHTCTLTTTDLPRLRIHSDSEARDTRRSEAKYLNVFTVGDLFTPCTTRFFSLKQNRPIVFVSELFKNALALKSDVSLWISEA